MSFVKFSLFLVVAAVLGTLFMTMVVDGVNGSEYVEREIVCEPTAEMSAEAYRILERTGGLPQDVLAEAVGYDPDLLCPNGRSSIGADLVGEYTYIHAEDGSLGVSSMYVYNRELRDYLNESGNGGVEG